MLIRKSLKNKEETIYRCDRCGKIIHNNDNYKILTKCWNDTSPEKRWDMCNDCFKLLRNTMNKHKNKIREW